MLDEKSSRDVRSGQSAGLATMAPATNAGRILCVGGAVVDTIFSAFRPIEPGTSNPVSGQRECGGVARNVAVNLSRLGVEVALASVVGDDENGRLLRGDLGDLGIDVSSVKIEPGWRTAQYVAVLEPDRSLNVGLADMRIFERLSLGLSVRAALAFKPVWIFVDCNCGADLIKALLSRAARGDTKLAIDAVSTAKAAHLPERLDGLDLLFLNLDEAAALLGSSRESLSPQEAVELLQGRGVSEVVLTLGAEGVIVGEATGPRTRIGGVRCPVADVTGAGDALVATTLAYRLAGLSLPEAARRGTHAASLTVGRVGGTHPDLSVDLIERLSERSPDTLWHLEHIKGTRDHNRRSD